MTAPADAPVASDAGRRRLGLVGLAVAGLSFLCSLLASGLVGGLYAMARGLDQDGARSDLGFALATSVGLWVGFLVLPLVWARRHGGPSPVLGLSARWVDLPLGLAVGLAAAVVTGLVSSVLLTRAQQDTLEAKAEEVVDRASGPVGVVLLVLALCVVTPLAEEVFFRGLLFRSLHRVTGVVAAALGAGIVFGLVHFSGGPALVVLAQLGLLGLFGVTLCVLAHRTGRLGASIVAHATFNAVTVVSLLAQR